MSEKKKVKLPPHRLLPMDAIARLRKAAMTEPSASRPDKRLRAIDAAAKHIRSQYPELFWECNA